MIQYIFFFLNMSILKKISLVLSLFPYHEHNIRKKHVRVSYPLRFDINNSNNKVCVIY